MDCGTILFTTTAVHRLTRVAKVGPPPRRGGVAHLSVSIEKAVSLYSTQRRCTPRRRTAARNFADFSRVQDPMVGHVGIPTTVVCAYRPALHVCARTLNTFSRAGGRIAFYLGPFADCIGIAGPVSVWNACTEREATTSDILLHQNAIVRRTYFADFQGSDGPRPRRAGSHAYCMQGCVEYHLAHVAIFPGVQVCANDIVGSIAMIAARSGKRALISIWKLSPNRLDGRRTILHQN